MAWVLLLVVAAGLVWLMVQPRRLQTLENKPAVVDQDLKAHDVVETAEESGPHGK